MNKIVIVGSLFFVLSCSSKDEQFCKCLKAGEKLNEASSKMLNGDATIEKAAEIKKLKEAKSQECADYQTMNGTEMLERKAECK